LLLFLISLGQVDRLLPLPPVDVDHPLAIEDEAAQMSDHRIDPAAVGRLGLGRSRRHGLPPLVGQLLEAAAGVGEDRLGSLEPIFYDGSRFLPLQRADAPWIDRPF
jgi:hypothetical protein